MAKSIYEIFPGITIMDEGPVEVRNPFSGESVMLTPEEAAVYDVTMGANMLGDYKTVRKGIDWFIKNNAAAYMVLLD
jgi:hypothetical protein